jgi:hypothetical protein
VKAALEDDHVRPPGRLAGQLDRRLDRLGPAVAKEETIQLRRRHLAQLADQVEQRLVVDDIHLAVQ